MNAVTIVQKLWNYCNILRDDGLSYGDYVEQLTFLLFLKMADEQSRPPFSRKSPIPAEYAWPKLVKLEGEPGHLLAEGRVAVGIRKPAAAGRDCAGDHGRSRSGAGADARDCCGLGRGAGLNLSRRTLPQVLPLLHSVDGPHPALRDNGAKPWGRP